MTTTPNTNRIEFERRYKHGTAFEDKVQAIFKQYGLPIYPYGMDQLPAEARRQLILLNDPTSLLLRFAPDYFCITQESSFFIECKSSMGQTPNYSYNLDSYNAGLELSRLGILILVVFGPELRAAWVHELPIRQVYDAGNYAGSGKAFVLIAKQDLPRLDVFIRNLKRNAQVTEH